MSTVQENGNGSCEKSRDTPKRLFSRHALINHVFFALHLFSIKIGDLIPSCDLLWNHFVARPRQLSDPCDF